MTEQLALEFNRVACQYGRCVIFSGVDLVVPAGEFAVIVGPTGGGKTTLLRAALGLLAPSTAEVRVLGDSPQRVRG